MKKPFTEFVPSGSASQRELDTWHNGADVEIHLYARSLQKAAKILVEKLDWNENPETAWDVGPIVFLYRQAIELGLKAVAGEGSGFLKTPTDHLTLAKTHSLRWLTQITCQIVKVAQWEAEFKCEGVCNLAEFSALVAEIEAMEPVSAAIYAERTKKKLGETPVQLGKKKVLEIVLKIDALIDLLATTADDLAATADLMNVHEGNRGQTIQ